MAKPEPPDVHPDAPAGGGGPGYFGSPGPLGSNPQTDWFGPSAQQWGIDSVLIAANAPKSAAVNKAPETDGAVEALELSATAKAAAYALKKKHPEVVFTSGRRNKSEQARAMASNVVSNRNWIGDTYVQSKARDACQKWVNEHKDKETKDEIAEGLKSVLDSLTDEELGRLSKHLSGAAFDVQPVEKNAAKIKATIKGLKGLSRFLDREGGLVRWHAQF